MAGFTPVRAEELIKWRGYSLEFCNWLRTENLIGLQGRDWALPVHSDAGAVIGIHCRVESNGLNKPVWYYQPKGICTRSLVFGDPRQAGIGFVFESPWDGFAVMDRLGWHRPKSIPNTAIVITRGAGNGKLIAGLFVPGATLYGFKQNDQTKHGKNPADEWLAEVSAHAGCKVLNVATPTQFKDVNDWTRTGATSADLMASIQDAKLVF